MSIVLTRATKQAARYTDAGGRERCSGCRFFMPQGTCGRIIGPVSPKGWCKYYSMEAVQKWQPQGAPFGHGGPSLGLDFISVPGTLPSGVVFTRASTATYFDGTGVMQTAAVNTPRWDSVPVTGAARGLLIEEARTNVLLNSANAALWTTAGTAPTVTANQTIAPDGTITAARVAYPATGITLLQNALTATANPYAFSVWLKGNVGGEQLYLSTTPDGALYYRLPVTLTTAWQRFALPAGPLTATTWYVFVGVDTRDASQSIKPAQTVFVWGGQIEQGAFATSYVPTTASAATRAADVATMATSPWYNAGPGSASVAFTNLAWPASAGLNNGVCTLDNGAGNRSNSIELVVFANSATYIQPTVSIVVASVQTGSVNTGNINVAGSGYTKCAATWQAGATVAVVCNGGAVASAALTTLPPITRLTLGNGYGGILPLNGYLRQFQYWPRVLSNAELQSVTT